MVKALNLNLVSSNIEENMDRRKFMKSLAVLGAGYALLPHSLFARQEGLHHEGIRRELDEATKALETKEYLSSRFLVGAMFYSKKYFEYLGQKNELEAHEIILDELTKRITPQDRFDYQTYLVDLARQKSTDSSVSGNLVHPVYNEGFDFGHNQDHAHQDALDVYPSETDAYMYAPVDMLITLAENNWNDKQPLSTISPIGGNTILTFDNARCFQWRFAHLKEAYPTPGESIEAGSKLGKTGSTGRNASKPGHGNHLHIEIHKMLDDFSGMTSLSRKEIEQILHTKK